MKAIAKKYEFNTKSTAEKYIKELWVEDARKTYSVDSVDENGDTIQIEKPYIAHVVVLGFLPIEQAEYDAEGEVVKEAVLSDKYSVDVLWESDIEDKWNTYEIEVEVSSHKFA